MDEAQTGARFDWLVELGGALAPGLSAAFAALKLAPTWGLAPPAATVAFGSAGFGLGLMAMRLVKPSPRQHVLAEFGVTPIEPGEEPVLLLEERYEEPLLLTELAEDDALLLDDPLVEAVPGSRVVQLFAGQPDADAGPAQGADRPPPRRRVAARERAGPLPRPDASGALYAALDDLRRSLR